MRLFSSLFAAAFVLSTLGAVVPTNAAMMMHMMKHHKGHMHMMHKTMCKGEFMMMDMKSHKCMDARNG